MTKYRSLTDSDTIQKGDQVLIDCGAWRDYPFGKGETIGETLFLGVRYQPNFYRPMRRKIKSK